MPTIQELASLIDPSNGCYFSPCPENPPPSLPSGHPFSNVQQSFYWSATSASDDPSGAWDAIFFPGEVQATPKNEVGGGFVWCVRGGQGVDPQ
jgi:hypothetical protein